MRSILPALVALLALAGPARADQALVLAGGTVVDGLGNPPLHNGVIVIQGDRITAIGGQDSVDIPAGAQVISTEGMTVLPGLWDLQVHIDRLGHADEQRWNRTYEPIAGRVVMPLAAAQLLHEGVTSARALAAPLQSAVSLRDRIRDNRLPGPTLFVTGPQLGKTVQDGAESWQWSVAGAADGRGKVDRLADAGVDYVLLAELELWAPDELAAVIDEARRRGLAVFAYGRRAAGIERGLDAKVDGFIDLDLGPAAGIPEEVMQAINARLRDTTQRRLSWSPAISGVLNYEDLRRNPEPLDDPAAVAGLPPVVAADLLSSLRNLGQVTWFDMPAARAPTLCTKLRQLQQAGVQLVVGSDSGAPAQLHTRAVWQEIDDWVRGCGLDPSYAIQAATHEAAVAMHADADSGSLAVGKYADIIAVRGDVLRTPALLQNVDIVVRHGRRYR